MSIPVTKDILATARSRRGWRPRGAILPTIMLAVGILVSIVLYKVIRDNVESAAEERFVHRVADATRVIENRVLSYAEVLYGARGLFSSHADVTRLQFHNFVRSLNLKSRFPGFDILNYAAHVGARDRDAFVESVRRDSSLNGAGYPAFKIKPPGERDEYFVIVYLEPLSGFEFAFGLDLGANPEVSAPDLLAATQTAARDSGELSASGLPIRVKTPSKEFVGLAMRLPVYRNGMPLETVEQRRAAYLGSVGAGFNVENLMKGVVDENTMRSIRFRVFGPASDGQSPAHRDDERLLFDSNQLVVGPPAALSGDDAGALFARVLPMKIAGRTWEVHFSATKGAFIDPVDRFFPGIVLAGGLILSTLLFGVLYSLASSRSRAVAIANDITRDLRESQEQLQALSRRLVEVQELERRRLSSELHDRVGQNLTALSINLDILKTRVGASAGEEVASRLDDSQHLLGATADTIDNVMSELRPPMLDDYGLHAALNWHAREFSRRTGVAVGVGGDEAGARPQPEIEITLFRIAQEALNNVAKHAHAEHVTIVLEFRERECIMSVADDGRGFAAGRSAGGSKRQGVGMVTMRERAQAVGGTFEVRAAPGGGTQVIVRVPR